jgi:hypothetical protein
VLTVRWAQRMATQPEEPATVRALVPASSWAWIQYATSSWLVSNIQKEGLSEVGGVFSETSRWR